MIDDQICVVDSEESTGMLTCGAAKTIPDTDTRNKTTLEKRIFRFVLEVVGVRFGLPCAAF